MKAGPRHALVQWVFFLLLGVPGLAILFISLSTLYAGEHTVRSVAACVAGSLMILTGVGKLRQPFYLLTFLAFCLGVFLTGKILVSLAVGSGKDTVLLALLGGGLVAFGVNALVRAYYSGTDARSSGRGAT